MMTIKMTTITMIIQSCTEEGKRYREEMLSRYREQENKKKMEFYRNER